MKKILMNPKGLWILLAALAVGLTGCKDNEPEIPTLPSISIVYNGVTTPNLSIDYDEDGVIKPATATSSFNVESTRAWAVTKVPSDASWVTVTPATGAVGTTEVAVSVDPNDGDLRSVTLTFKSTDGSNVSQKVVVNQDGDIPVIVDATPIADFYAEYYNNVVTATGQSVTLTKAYTFAGTVVSDPDNGNVVNGSVMVQDDTKPHSGVIFRIFDSGTKLGDYVKVTVASGATVSIFSGAFQVAATAMEIFANTTPDVATIGIEDILNYESQLVRIEGVQSVSSAETKWYTGTATVSSKAFEDEDGNTFDVYVRNGASFAQETMPTGSGYILGVAGNFNGGSQLAPRNSGDLQFLTGERFQGSGGGDKEGQYILLQENMGSENSPTPYTNVNAWDAAGKFQKAGLGAGSVSYSTPTATGTTDASVRYAAGAISANYDKASAGNNVFFGGAETPTFIVSDIALGGTNQLYLGFGYNNKSASLTVSYKEDSGAWKPLTLTEKTSTSWNYLVTPLNVTPGTELLSLQFATTVKSTLRIDDIYLTTDQTYTPSHIPSVTTGTSTVTGQSATLNGSYTYDGTATDITECGFAYKISSAAAFTEVTATAGATFSQTVSSLPEGVYSWYAYVKKSTKTYAGDTESFTIQPAVMTTVSISSVVSGWSAGGTIPVGNQIKGTIVSDRTGANYSNPSSSFMIVDGTDQNSGLLIYRLKQEDGTTDATHTFSAGDQVVVNIGGAKMTTFHGLREMEGIKLSAVTPDTSGTPAYASPVTINSADLDKYMSMLVKIACEPASDVIGDAWNGSKTFKDSASAEFVVYTAGTATFKDALIPAASGTITGIAGSYDVMQLAPRNLTDISLGTAMSYFSVSTQAVPVPAAGGNATVNVTANVNWTAAVTDGAANITSGPTPASGNDSQTITLVFPANTDAVNTKSVTLRVSATGSGLTPDYYDVVFTQAKASSGPAVLFPGSDFNNWTTFTSSVTGLKTAYAKESATGGRDGSGALHLDGTPGSNEAVFTAQAPSGSPASMSKITFYVKGTSAKSLSINVYTTDAGVTNGYYIYNLGARTGSADVTLTSTGSNSYTGAVDTSGGWMKVTLDVSGKGIATSGNILAVRVGSAALYNLYIDDITYE